MAHEIEAGPHPIRAIFVSYEAGRSFGSFGSLICFTFISLKKVIAVSYNLLILIGPSSSWKTLQEPAQS